MKELNGFNVATRDLTSWSQTETESFIERYISENNRLLMPDLIVCGNDAMALGAVRGVRRVLKDSSQMPKIFGYDGLFRALVAISDEANPFCATISIPPSSYGKYAAMSIIQKVFRKRPDNREGLKKIIPIRKENLVTIEKANDYLDNEPWAQ